MTSPNKMKLLVICGPTGTGKTSLGIELSQKFNGEIISADSRQIYKDFDIGTGKSNVDSMDVPIWGYDLVDPSEEFSVSDFVRFAKIKIIDIDSQQKLPLLIGGTGLYIRSVIRKYEDIHIPPNPILRSEIAHFSETQLFEKLLQLDPHTAVQLNESVDSVVLLTTSSRSPVQRQIIWPRAC